MHHPHLWNLIKKQISHLTTRDETNNFNVVSSQSHTSGLQYKTPDCNQHKFWKLLIALVVNGVKFLRNRCLFKNKRIMNASHCHQIVGICYVRIEASPWRFSICRPSPIAASSCWTMNLMLKVDVLSFKMFVYWSLPFHESHVFDTFSRHDTTRCQNKT